jgi:type 1 glutamine amidotransferase
MITRRHLLLSALPLFASAAPAPAARIVFMIGEEEYHTWETLPDFAAKELKAQGHQVTIIQADATDKNSFPGLIEALRDADLLFVSARRRQPHKEQLDAVRAHVAAGKPVVGIRTASHAFALLPKATLTDPKLAIWPEFDAEVLGGNYHGHCKLDERNSVISLAPNAETHPILQGIAVAKMVGHGELYKNDPLPSGSTPLLMGTLPDQPSEPVAWTHLSGGKHARVFYTSLGHWDDFSNPEFRRFLGNGVQWALGK